MPEINRSAGEFIHPLVGLRWSFASPVRVMGYGREQGSFELSSRREAEGDGFHHQRLSTNRSEIPGPSRNGPARRRQTAQGMESREKGTRHFFAFLRRSGHHGSSASHNSSMYMSGSATPQPPLLRGNNTAVSLPITLSWVS